MSSDTRSLRTAAALALLAASWAFLFRNEFPLLLSHWDSDDFSYCYLVPLLAGYLVWERRAEVCANLGGPTWPGLVLLALAGGFLLAGRLGSLETFVFFAIWLSLVGGAIALLGLRAMRPLAFPALILLFIVPPPSYVERTLSFQLRLVSSEVSALILRLLSVPVFLEGNIIDLGSIKLQVVDACSGLRYFLPTILISLIVGQLMNRTALARTALFLLSAPVSITLNAVRITITGVLVRYVSPTLADGFFHDFQGWIIYLAAVALLGALSLLLRRWEGPGPVTPAPEQADGPAQDTDATAEPKPAAAPALPASGWIAGLCAAALCLAVSQGVSYSAQAQIVPEWRSLDSFPLQIGQWRGFRSYLDKETLESLWADDYFVATYQADARGGSLNLLIPYYKSQTAQHTAHAPTSCLLGSGWEIASRRILPPSPQSGRAFSVQQMVLVKNGERLLSNFWFQQRGRIYASEWENKAFLLQDALTMRRTDGALVRVELLLPRELGLDEAQAKLDQFSTEVSRLLGDYLPGAPGSTLAGKAG